MQTLRLGQQLGFSLDAIRVRQAAFDWANRLARLLRVKPDALATPIGRDDRLTVIA
jgi:hypothetical protein